MRSLSYSPPRQRSLRKMLLLAMVGFTVLGWMAGGLITGQLAERTETELHKREIRNIARLLLGLSDHELEEIGPNADAFARVAMGRADTQALGDDYRFQIWSDDGAYMLGNFGAGAHAAMAPFHQTGFTRTNMDGDTWRVYALHDADRKLQIQVAEREKSDLSILSAFDGQIVALMVASLALVLLPAIWVLRHLIRPINDVARALERRNPDSLEPLPTTALPSEVSPMVDALNRLFGRLDTALQRERSFTGVAAHELRTPLAAVRVLAQVVRAAENYVERDDALDRLILGTDRCAHLLDQLLTLQRLDAMAVHEFNEAIDTTEVVMEVVDSTRLDAQRRGVIVSARLDGSSLRGHRFGMLTLLRNLVSNSINYTPAGGRVEITTRREEDATTVTVDDSGIGIAPEQRERAFARFERLGAKSGTGVGLGLSIVRTVAEAHGAGIELGDSPLGGLRVTVRFAGRAMGELADELTLPPDSLPSDPSTRPIDA